MKSKAVIPSFLRILLVLIVLLMRVGGDFSVYDDLRSHVEATDPSACDADIHESHHHQADFEPFHFQLIPPPELQFSHFVQENRTCAFTAVTRHIARAPPV